jgi:acetyl-CoA C-acetyltransferase
VGANGGLLSKYSAGIYSTRPVRWKRGRSAELQSDIDSSPTVTHAESADGWATLETYTITHSRTGKTGIVVGRLESDDRRFVANVVDGDRDMFELLDGEKPFGSRVFVRSTNRGNRVTTTKSRMSKLLPQKVPGLRTDYEHIEVTRAGHLIVINRPHVRNSLHPPTNDELEEAFDAFFADPDLWVAIITGAGTTAFSAGNDLVYSATGGEMWVPRTGFGGLTSRAGMNKPVIAAVNGFAMGGGFEIALACHLVVADESAVFALSEVKVGLVAGAGGLVRLPRSVPEKVATEMILTGKRIDALTALRLGVVNRVVDAGQALEGARELAAELLSVSPTSVRTSLEIMTQTQGIADTVAAVGQPSTAIDDLLVSEDMREGMLAFTEKRSPRWKNR